MLLLLMLTSKGMAGVPRASLVVIAATLNQFNIPEAGLLLIMGIDQFLDMGRSATNAVGNSVAAAVVAKWEGGLLPENQFDPEVDDVDVTTPVGLPGTAAPRCGAACSPWFSRSALRARSNSARRQRSPRTRTTPRRSS
jgi:hypothetical protein